MGMVGLFWVVVGGDAFFWVVVGIFWLVVGGDGWW